jgi:hypothetical protein
MTGGIGLETPWSGSIFKTLRLPLEGGVVEMMKVAWEERLPWPAASRCWIAQRLAQQM